MADLGEFGRAVAELVSDEPDTFRFHGDRFELPAAISSLVPMRFTHAVKAGQEAQTAAEARAANAEALKARARTPDAVAAADEKLREAELARVTANTSVMSAMYEYIRGCVGDDQWARFEAVCLRDAVESDELMDLCGRIFEAVAGRPTRRPSDSSDGPSSTGATSTDGAGSPEQPPGLRVITAQEPPVWGSAPDPAAPTPVETETDSEAQIRAWREQMQPVGELLGIRSGA